MCGCVKSLKRHNSKIGGGPKDQDNVDGVPLTVDSIEETEAVGGVDDSGPDFEPLHRAIRQRSRRINPVELTDAAEALSVLSGELTMNKHISACLKA